MAPMQPSPHYRQFRSGQCPKSAAAFLGRLVWERFAGRVVLLILGTLGGIGLMTLEPLFLRDLVETLRQGGITDPWSWEIWRPFVIVAGAWLLSSGMNRLRDIVDLKTVPDLTYEVQARLFSYLIEHSPDFFNANFSGALSQKIAQAGGAVTSIIGIAFNEMVRVVAAIAIGTIILGRDFPHIGLALVGWSLFYFTLVVLLSRRCQTLSAAYSQQAAQSMGVVVDVVANADLVRAFARGPQECLRVGRALGDTCAAAKRLRWYLILMWGVLFALILLFQITMIAMAVHQAAMGAMVVGDLVMVMSLSAILYGNLWAMACRTLEFIEQVGILKSSIEAITIDHAITDAPGAQALVVDKGEIRLEAVSFAHHDGTVVFKDLDLEIGAGEKVGIVGLSGAGKSTLVRLMRRHFEPQSGRVRIDGQDIARVTQQSLNQAIAEVPQQPGLFHRSIADNIRYSKPDASEAEIILAAQSAHCHDFISQRPQGYDALVGEHGVQLSGGERQRIAIARALLKDSRILILDEATSALDSETEQAIREGLWHLFENRTVIAIAHRLSTISRMDRILYLEAGRIVEQGRHEDLLAQGGRYAALWNRQVGGFIVGE
jgi:ATP-binding cassette subfamily B protein